MLDNFTPGQRNVLRALRDLLCATRKEVSESTGMTRQQVSNQFSRLEALGYVVNPEDPTQPWKLSEAGLRLFEPAASIQNEPAELIEAESAELEESELEASAEALESKQQSFLDAVREEEDRMIAELDPYLDWVCQRLTSPAIPPTAKYAYWRLISNLPEQVSAALAPITEWVMK